MTDDKFVEQDGFRFEDKETYSQADVKQLLTQKDNAMNKLQEEKTTARKINGHLVNVKEEDRDFVKKYLQKSDPKDLDTTARELRETMPRFFKSKEDLSTRGQNRLVNAYDQAAFTKALDEYNTHRVTEQEQKIYDHVRRNGVDFTTVDGSEEWVKYRSISQKIKNNRKG